MLPSGTKHTKLYMLTPNAFKLCLIRAKNSKEYAKYYLLFEKMYGFFKDYRTLYQNKLISMKDDKIDEQSKKIDEILKENKKQSSKMDEQSKKIEELLNYGKKTSEKLDDVQEDLNYTNEKLDDLFDKVEDMKDTFEDTANHSVPDPARESHKSKYIVLRHKENVNQYIFIRGIQEYNEPRIEEKYEEEYDEVVREFNSNPIQLYKLFKKTIIDEFKEAKRIVTADKTIKKGKLKLKAPLEKIKFDGIKFELVNNYSEEQLFQKIKNIVNFKFTEYKEASDNIPTP